MSKEILFIPQSWNKMLDGLNIVANAIKATAGPKGKNVIIEQKHLPPLIVNDGFTIAKAITLSDPFMNLGASLIKEAALSTNEVAGDGTTTATILTASFINQAVKIIQKHNYTLVKKGMTKAVLATLEHLNSNKRLITTKQEIQAIASISSNDEKIGRIISEAIAKNGENSLLLVDDSPSIETYFKNVDGMQFNGGYCATYMVNDLEKMQVVFEKALVLISQEPLLNFKDILHILEKVREQKKQLVLIVKEISDDVLNTLAINKMRNIINVTVIKCDAYGERLSDLLFDLSILTKTICVNKSLGSNFSDLQFEQLGMLNKIIVTKDQTTIINNQNDNDLLSNHLINLKKRLTLVNAQEKEQLEKRIAQLTSAIGIIYVGGETEIEQKEYKYRIEDALNATKAAINDGIVLGGGCAFLQAKKSIENLTDPNFAVNAGIEIIKEGLKAPLQQIINNTGEENCEAIIKQILNDNKNEFGYDALSETIVNMWTEGIIDPYKVVKIALEKALSVSLSFISTEAAIVESKEKSSFIFPTLGESS